MLCSAAVDTQDFTYLWPLGPGTGADLERRAWRHASVAAALKHAYMQEGVARPIGKLHEAESLLGIVPFDNPPDRGTGGRFKPLGARWKSEIVLGWFEVVIIETAAPGRTKISVSVTHVISLGGYGSTRTLKWRRMIVN